MKRPRRPAVANSLLLEILNNQSLTSQQIGVVQGQALSIMDEQKRRADVQDRIENKIDGLTQGYSTVCGRLSILESEFRDIRPRLHDLFDNYQQRAGRMKLIAWGGQAISKGKVVMFSLIAGATSLWAWLAGWPK
jgi:hypothetical protein